MCPCSPVSGEGGREDRVLNQPEPSLLTRASPWHRQKSILSPLCLCEAVAPPGSAGAAASLQAGMEPARSQCPPLLSQGLTEPCRHPQHRYFPRISKETNKQKSSMMAGCHVRKNLQIYSKRKPSFTYWDSLIWGKILLKKP